MFITLREYSTHLNMMYYNYIIYRVILCTLKNYNTFVVLHTSVLLTEDITIENGLEHLKKNIEKEDSSSPDLQCDTTTKE